MTDKGAPTVVVGKSEPQSLKLPGFRPPSLKQPGWLKRYHKPAAIAVVIAVVAIGGYWWYKAAHNPNITIGKTVITPAEIQELTHEISIYSSATGENFGGPARRVAQNELIFNAALKDQANKHNIQVSQVDIDASLASQYQYYGSKALYESYLKKAGITNQSAITAENNVYQSKLMNIAIARKDLFLVVITYDTPYFSASSDPAALRAQAVKTLQTKFLPLFKEGKSNAQIAARVDINYFAPGPHSDPTPFITGMPTTAFGVPSCTTARPCFNDAQVGQFASLPGIVSTQSKVDQLNKAGQYTNVFTSKAGFIGIMRLTSKTGGAYNSWDQLLKDYDQQYAPHVVFLSLPQANSGANI